MYVSRDSRPDLLRTTPPPPAEIELAHLSVDATTVSRITKNRKPFSKTDLFLFR